MKLDIKYSLDFEVERVKNTLARLDWFNEQGYRPRLPDGVSKGSSDSEIKQVIEAEFDQSIYEQAKQKLSDRFIPVADQFNSALVEVFDSSIDTIVINLTGYGVGGSYHLPSTIVINHHMSDLFKTVIHEIVHLMIQENIEKHEIEHWEKERIVDLILNSEQFSFLEYDSMQDTKGTEKYVDGLFNECFFKDKEQFFKQMKTVR